MWNKIRYWYWEQCWHWKHRNEKAMKPNLIDKFKQYVKNKLLESYYKERMFIIPYSQFKSLYDELQLLRIEVTKLKEVSNGNPEQVDKGN